MIIASISLRAAGKCGHAEGMQTTEEQFYPAVIAQSNCSLCKSTGLKLDTVKYTAKAIIVNMSSCPCTTAVMKR